MDIEITQKQIIELNKIRRLLRSPDIESRVLGLTTFLNNEMITLLNTSTAVVVSPIPSPLIADVVTASVGHIPSINTNVGFSFINPL